MVYTSGVGHLTSSGLVLLSTANAGFQGVSGSITMSTGTSSLGCSGYYYLGTGEASSGAGGDIDIVVGTGHLYDGGNIYMISGETTAVGETGGWVQITGGKGSNTDAGNGGDGGAVFIDGGAAKGANNLDLGGNIELTGGKADAGTGGNIIIETGMGFATSSGYIKLHTQNSGSSELGQTLVLEVADPIRVRYLRYSK